MIRLPLPHFRALVAAIFISSAAGACSMKPSQATGFLKGGYEGMAAQPSRASFKSRIPAPGELAKYTGVIIEPVAFDPHSGADMKRIDAKEIEKLKSYFTAQLKTQFGARYQIVNRAGANTLRVRAAITDARGTVALLNIHPSTLLLTRGGVGGCAMEAEFLDSTSGRQLASFMDVRMGNPLGYFNGFDPIGHSKQVIRSWSKLLRQSFDTARGN